MIHEIKKYYILNVFKATYNGIYRRARGDMTEVYKIVKEIYDSKTTCNILKYRDKIHLSLRGHNYILEHKRLYNSTRVHFFRK